MSRRQQKGVAVVTALLLTTLAITIVASLFWQQQVRVRSIENQRLQSQKEWILRGALDWASLILRNDALYSPVTHLGAPWATPLKPTKLDDFVEGGTGDPDAAGVTLEGSVEDAQARFNLAGLVQNGTVNPREVAAFGRLLGVLGMSPTLAQATADLMRQSQQGTQEGQPQGQGQRPSRPLTITRPQDLLAVPGFNVEMFGKLRDFIVVLPRATPVSANTAPAEVLAARIDGLSMAEAQTLVAARKTAYFNNIGDLQNRLPGKTINPSDLAFVSNFFLVNGDVKMGRAALQVQSLIERMNGRATVLWTVEK